MVFGVLLRERSLPKLLSEENMNKQVKKESLIKLTSFWARSCPNLSSTWFPTRTPVL
jgi:hypothetical protein